MAAIDKNWALWDFDERPNFRINTGNPTVGFGGGDESQNSGPHGFKLSLTSSYQSLSQGSWAGTGHFVDNKEIQNEI